MSELYAGMQLLVTGPANNLQFMNTDDQTLEASTSQPVNLKNHPITTAPVGNSNIGETVPVASTSGVSSAHVTRGKTTRFASTIPEMPTESSLSDQKRRSSSRSIKRKKFDDELVESSLVKTYRTRPPTSIAHGGSTMTSSGVIVSGFGDQLSPELVATYHTERKKNPKSAAKRVKKSKNFQALVTKDLGRWKPTDDLALIIAVQQANDLGAVHQGVKFSCKFTLQEIQEHWYALLYDPIISKVAVSAMKSMHPEIVAAVQSKALYSKAEEQHLKSIPSVSQPTLDTFQQLLDKNTDSFYLSRTAKALQSHWLLMRQYHLLPDQSVSGQQTTRPDCFLSFSDAEDMISDSELQDPPDEQLEQELMASDRRVKREIRQLENELPKWQVMVDSITGITMPDFDGQTLAILRGRLVRYLMRSREITLGRSTKDNMVDVDLSLEGPAWKISRRQGTIKLNTAGEFFVSNEGRRSIFVDSKPILTGSKIKLNNNSVVEISGLRFIFLIHQEAINGLLRLDQTKQVT